MSLKKLFDENLNAKEVITDWYLKVLSGSNVDPEVDDERVFKLYVEEMKSRIDDLLVESIEKTPRMLLDVLDDNQLYISCLISIDNNNAKFAYLIHPRDNDTTEYDWYDDRKECELAAVMDAIILLEEKFKENNR